MITFNSPLNRSHLPFVSLSRHLFSSTYPLQPELTLTSRFPASLLFALLLPLSALSLGFSADLVHQGRIYGYASQTVQHTLTYALFCSCFGAALGLAFFATVFAGGGGHSVSSSSSRGMFETDRSELDRRRADDLFVFCWFIESSRSDSNPSLPVNLVVSESPLCLRKPELIHLASASQLVPQLSLVRLPSPCPVFSLSLINSFVG